MRLKNRNLSKNLQKAEYNFNLFRYKYKYKVMASIYFLLCTIPLTWVIALILWLRYFQKHKSDWLSWFSLIVMFFPALFYILSAYMDKIAKAGDQKYNTTVTNLIFRLRISICRCCWVAQLIVCFTLKYIGIEYYFEISVGCMNIFQSLLIWTCWDILNTKQTKELQWVSD